MGGYDDTAKKNLAALKANVYAGRGIVAGLDPTGAKLVQVYWIMGRSEKSRNRVFKSEGGHLSVIIADTTKVAANEDLSLITYNAMMEEDERFVVSNGDQTDTVIDGLRSGLGFTGALEPRTYENDPPNYTSRITAVSISADNYPRVMISIISKVPDSAASVRKTHHYDKQDLSAGFGYCITTYKGDGNPLPAFEGYPYLMPLAGDIGKVLDTYWDALNPDNRISLAVKFIDIKSGKSGVRIINKFNKVSGH